MGVVVGVAVIDPSETAEQNQEQLGWRGILWCFVLAIRRYSAYALNISRDSLLAAIGQAIVESVFGTSVQSGGRMCGPHGSSNRPRTTSPSSFLDNAKHPGFQEGPVGGTPNSVANPRGPAFEPGSSGDDLDRHSRRPGRDWFNRKDLLTFDVGSDPGTPNNLSNPRDSVVRF